MKHKKLIITTFSAAVIILATTPFIKNYIEQTYKLCSYNSANLQETSAFIQNPYQGFYHLYGYTLTNDNTDKALSLANTIGKDSYSLALLEINLKNFNNCNLSDEALLQLDTLLSECENSGKKLLLRFLYDWDGKAKETEPDDISQILTHITQVSTFVNMHKNTVYIIQGIFVGNCGEMNNSIYMSNENMLTLINKLDEVIDKDIFLSVRTPAHYRIINNRTTPLSDEEAFNNTLSARLGLFNDGMLGSSIDLGTYGTSSFEGSTNPADKGTRAEEIAFQKQLCNYVPNGGECVIDNEYNDFENAVADLADMHISYLNCDYDKAVLDKWRNSTYNSNDVFNGVNGYDYIASHLGYRFLVSDSSIKYSRFKSHNATLKFTLKNSGFSSAYKNFKSEIILVNNDTNENKIYTVSYDIRKLHSKTEKNISLKINTSDLDNGTYSIYFVMTDEASNTKIKLSNENYSDENGILLGELIIG